MELSSIVSDEGGHLIYQQTGRQERSCQEIATRETTREIFTAEARAKEGAEVVKAAPVIEVTARIMAAKAARSTEISARTILTQRDEAAQPEAADVTTGATTTGAEVVVTRIARITVTTSDTTAVTLAQMKDAAVAAKLTAMMMDAHGLRRRVGGLRSEQGAEPRARMCAAATL
jgi:hypothetical protein